VEGSYEAPFYNPLSDIMPMVASVNITFTLLGRNCEISNDGRLTAYGRLGAAEMFASGRAIRKTPQPDALYDAKNLAKQLKVKGLANTATTASAAAAQQAQFAKDKKVNEMKTASAKKAASAAFLAAIRLTAKTTGFRDSDAKPVYDDEE